MPRYWCALSIVIAAAATAPNVAAQQPGSAGATRPKLRVLQTLPESQLFPLMNLLADSLGVRCDYCHVQVTPDLTRTPSNVGGWVWDRDDKPQKRTAREMMRMVIDLSDFDRSTWVNSTGQSGHAYDDHYIDQIDAWAANETFPWPFSPAAVGEATEDELALVPPGTATP